MTVFTAKSRHMMCSMGKLTLYKTRRINCVVATNCVISREVCQEPSNFDLFVGIDVHSLLE